MKHSWAGPVSENMEARANWLIDEQNFIESDIQRLITLLAVRRVELKAYWDAYWDGVQPRGKGIRINEA